jgi:hypothetical protein
MVEEFEFAELLGDGGVAGDGEAHQHGTSMAPRGRMSDCFNKKRFNTVS